MKKQNFEQPIVAARRKNLRRNEWHPAFVQALKMELREYMGVLEFRPEYELTSGPRRIDCLVIKKLKDVEIKKNIAAIFRGHNIIEYKSPGDYVSIRDFYNVYSYACQYVSNENAPVTGITISFVTSSHPHKLLKHLREVRDYTVAKTAPGVYTISGDIMPMQIVDSRELSADENLWLRRLSNKLDPSEAAQIHEKMKRHGKGAELDAFQSVIFNANPNAMQEAIKMTKLQKSALMKTMEEAGWADEWVTQGEAKGKIIGFEEGKLAIARKMKSAGRPFSEIAEFTDLSIKTIEKL